MIPWYLIEDFTCRNNKGREVQWGNMSYKNADRWPINSILRRQQKSIGVVGVKGRGYQTKL